MGLEHHSPHLYSHSGSTVFVHRAPADVVVDVGAAVGELAADVVVGAADGEVEEDVVAVVGAAVGEIEEDVVLDWVVDDDDEDEPKLQSWRDSRSLAT